MAAGEVVRWADVEVDGTQSAVQVRREMEGMFARAMAVTGLPR